MRSQVIGQLVVTVFVVVFAYLLFRGMVYEWHRRDRELRGQSH